MNEAVLSVPGDPERPAKLVVTVLTPNGSGPFPLVVMNHGSNAGTKPSQEQRYRYTFSAYYFLSRGYAVVLPMMRGFAGSQGQQIQDGCNQAAIGVANAKDIRAVIEFMSAQPCMDGEHVVVAGQSFGGWNTLAFVTLHYPKVKALINFAGGANISECPLNDSALVHAAETYGAQTTIPSLWFYGDNDDIFAPPVWHAMLDHYTAAGGHAELVAFGRFMKNSHNMLGFREGLGIWAPKVDALLASVELPSSVTHPEYLPAEFPPPTMFAAIDNVDAVPYLTDGVRQTYRKFLTDPMPKVFVFSQTGLAASFNGGFDPLGRAMKACEERSQKCQVYAVDDYVAWARPTSAPPPTHFASITDLAAVPHLNDRGRQGYQKYLALRKPKAFVIAPDGGWFFASLGDDPLTNALRSCQNSHVGCQLYAVDDAVVWPGNPL
jgi:dienelactone hydrolase